MNIKNKVRSSYPSNAQGINHSIAENVVVDLTKYKVQPDSTLPVLPNNLLAERILQDYAVTCLPSHNSTGYDADKAKKDLEYLNLKLDAVRKTITSGDVYNIKGVAESVDEVNRMITVATPNTAFISNVRVINSQDPTKNIAPGDIIFTDLNQVQHIIQHGAAGYFYPARWKKVQDTAHLDKVINTYQLTYSGTTEEPRETPKTGSENNINGDAIKEIAYHDMCAQLDAGATPGFAHTYLLTEHATQLIQNYPVDTENQSRIPIINVTNSAGEKIGIDGILFKEQAQGKIYNPTSFSIIVEVR